MLIRFRNQNHANFLLILWIVIKNLDSKGSMFASDWFTHITRKSEASNIQSEVCQKGKNKMCLVFLKVTSL